jgi:hypothetical protein
MSASAPPSEQGIVLVSRFLEGAGIAHDVVEHQATYTAVEEARAAREEPRHTAKSHLRLATEEEMRKAFPFFEVGALPPVGPMLPLPEVLDVRLLYRDSVLCAGGDHRHAVRLDPRDLVRIAEPRVGDLCEHDPAPHRKDFGELPKS